MNRPTTIALVLLCLGLYACEGRLSTDAVDEVSDSIPETTTTPDGTDPPEFDGTIPDADECEGLPIDPGPGLARRLTNWEYTNTVQQTFGVDVSAEVAEKLPADLRAGGFTNTNDAMLVTLDHTEAYGELALDVVTKLDWNAWVSARSCTEATDACQREFTEATGASRFADLWTEKRSTCSSRFSRSPLRRAMTSSWAQSW